MTDKTQILLAFLSPLFLAVVFSLFAYFFLQPDCLSSFEYQGKRVCDNYHETFFASGEYALITLGLIILSFILPFFVIWRTRQFRKAKYEPIIKI